MSEVTVRIDAVQAVFGKTAIRLFQEGKGPGDTGILYIYTEVPTSLCDITKGMPPDELEGASSKPKTLDNLEPMKRERGGFALVANAICSACQSHANCQGVEK